MDTKQLLLEFSALEGVSGHESCAAAYAAAQLAPFGEVTTTPLGSVICAVRPAAEGAPHLLLEAHIDEIGLVVTTIDESGFLRVAPCGGIDQRLLAAAPVIIHAEEGPLPGVVCSVPPHLSGDGAKKNPKVTDVYVDTGYSADAVKEKIHPGDIITLQATPRELMGGLVSGKALDDRAGCTAHLKALEYLGDTALTCGLSVLFSTMEETGMQGAQTGAYQIAPTHAIAVDVSFAHTPDSAKEKCGELRKGPMVGFAPILSAEMSRRMIELAREKEIPCQHEVMGGRTGTNADAIATIRGGVLTALLSVPQRYMHTPIETLAVCDVENTARLITEYIKETWGVK